MNAIQAEQIRRSQSPKYYHKPMCSHEGCKEQEELLYNDYANDHMCVFHVNMLMREAEIKKEPEFILE